MEHKITHFPYNVFETIFTYDYLYDLDGEPPSYGFLSRLLKRGRADVQLNARRIEALGLGKIHKMGRPYNIAWLEMLPIGRELYDMALSKSIPVALLCDVSSPPCEFILNTVPGLDIVVLTRLDYFGMLDDIRAITGTKHRSYTPLALGGATGRSEAVEKARRNYLET